MHNLTRSTVVAVSRFYSTPAIPLGSGPNYVNAAVSLRTPLNPLDLLQELHRIEAGFGRDRDGRRWKARTVDLDLLAMGDAVLPDTPTQSRWRALPLAEQMLTAPGELILPHPRMQDRGFVLVPLADVAPGWRHPLTGRSVQQMLDDLPRDALSTIRPIET